MDSLIGSDTRLISHRLSQSRLMWHTTRAAVQLIDIVVLDRLDQSIGLGLKESRHILHVRGKHGVGFVTELILQMDGDDTDEHLVKGNRFEDLKWRVGKRVRNTI